MKRLTKLSFIFTLLLLLVLPQSNNVSAMYQEDIDSTDTSVEAYNQGLLSKIVQDQAGSYCAGWTRSVDETELDEISSVPYLSNFTSEIRTSVAGSRIVLPATGNRHGYCHIFQRHMKYSNGRTKHEVGDASQFQYARYPKPTMDIIMQVVNGTKILMDTNDPNRKYKIAWSTTEKQNVKVILHRGRDFNPYGAYDWVVVTAHPVF